VDSGLEWVSLRPTVFASNFAGMWSPQLQAGDVVNGPFASASNASIVNRDISAVATQALLTHDLVGHKIALTGPHSHTNAELVQIIGTVVNRRLRYRGVPPSQVHEGFVALGFSAAFADAYIGFLSATVDKPAAVTREVDNILGRPAQSFADWIAEHRAPFTR
jgi:uncharacterized protein YbjT (DUF2867 family)